MKKTLLSFLCIGATYMAMSQNNIPNNNQNNQNNPSNNTTTNSTTPATDPSTVRPDENTNMNNTVAPANATTTYSLTVPSSVQSSFQAAYPSAAKVAWSQSGDWYRARYMENGKVMEASYREDGKSYVRTAGPVLRTFVPEEAVTKALEMYGMNVYAIAATKGANGEVYNVTIIENGQSRTEWMNADGSAVTSPYRTEEQEATSTSADVKTTTTSDVQESSETDAQPAEATDNLGGGLPSGSELQHDMKQSTDEQNTEEQLEEDSIKTEGINNGQTSDDAIREMNDEAYPEVPLH